MNRPGANERLSGQRVLYERFISKHDAAFWSIDQGMINALRALGAEVVERAAGDATGFERTLRSFRPALFLGCLQQTDRSPAPWLCAGSLDAIEACRANCGLRVAVRSSPSNMPDYVASQRIAFEQFKDKGVSGFYLQPARPDEAERRAFDRGVIDLIRSPLHKECYPVCFRSYLERGLGVLEEPHAGDAGRYHRPPPCAHEWDALYIGGCWAFKWENMRGYIEALAARFGPKFALFGSGWPEHIHTNGVLPYTTPHGAHQPAADSRQPTAI